MLNKPRQLCALISCAFILLQPYAACLADPLSNIDPVAPPPQSSGAPGPAPLVPSLSNTVPPEIAALLAPSTNQQQTILDIAQTGGTISFTGDFINKDNLYIISTSSQYLTANLFASGSIYNAANASISTLIPAGISNAISGLSLVVTAGNNILNAGTISSAGALSLNAGNSIVNIIAPQTPNVIPSMQAQTDLSMQAVNIINQGSIQSALANINIASLTNSLAINSLGGSFSAPTGIINVLTPDVLSSGALDILGGDFISKALDLQSDAVNVQANSIFGILNLDASTAAVQCTTGNLIIGNFQVSGKTNNALNAFSSFALTNEDPTYIYTDGNLIFVADTFAPALSLSGRNILNGGASTISSESGLSLTASENINLAGLKTLYGESSVSLYAPESMDLGGISIGTGKTGSVSLVADKNILLPGTKISSGFSGVTVVAGGDLTGPGTIIDSSTAPGDPGPIFLASINGAIDLGNKSVITTGAGAPGTVIVGPGAIFAISAASHNGLTLGTVTAPAGEIILGSGITTVGDRFNGWLSKTLTGPTHLGSGGITVGDVSIRTDGSLSDARLIVHSTNGSINATSFAGNGGLVSLLATDNMSVTQGVNNVSTAATGGTVLVSFRAHVNMPTGIINDAVSGAGGQVFVGAQAPQGFTLGKDLKVSNNAATNGGSISAENIGGSLFLDPTGLSGTTNGDGTSLFLFTQKSDENVAAIEFSGSLHIADAKGDGRGGTVSFSSADDLIVSNALITSNGSGSGSGGSVGLASSRNVLLSETTAVVDGGSNGEGGVFSVSGKALDATGLTISANGHGSSQGGVVSFSLSDFVNLTGTTTNASARGANGGTLLVYSDGPITVESGWFDISPYGGVPGAGNGGRIEMLSWASQITTIGNLSVDGVDSGNGGGIYLTSQGAGSNLTVGATGDTKFFARGGKDGGNGGRIDLRTGGDLLVLDSAVLSAQVRGEHGHGGTILLYAGYNNTSGGSLYLNKSLNVSGKGNGVGGNISLFAVTGQGGGGPVETFGLAAVGPSDGRGVLVNANVIANGAGDGNGGTVDIGLTGEGSIKLNGTIQASAGTIGRGGFVTINATGENASVEASGKIIANGGTESGDGGFIDIKSNGSLLLNTTDVSADARGDGKGGSIVVVTSGADDGGAAVTALSSTQGTSIFHISGTISADAGTTGKGGVITLEVNSANGAVDFASDARLFARGGTQEGHGGEISLNITGQSKIEISDISVSSRGSGNGGNILLQGKNSLSFISNSITADSHNLGNGGKIEIRVSGEDSDLTVGKEPNTLTLNARSGLAGGNGGQVLLSAGRSITLPNTSVHVDARGTGAGAGGTITIEGNKNGSSGNISILGYFSAKHPGGGNPGQIEVHGHKSINNSTTTINIDGKLIVDSEMVGNGGTINIIADQDGSSIVAGARKPTTLSASGAGAGGTINVHSNGVLDLGDSLLQADSTGGKGGMISISALGNSADLALDADGNVGRVSAKGLEGGSIKLASGRNLTVQGARLAAINPISGAGPSVELSSGLNSGGLLKLLGTLDASGRNEGIGGSVSIHASSGADGTGLSKVILSGSILVQGGTKIDPMIDADGKIQIVTREFHNSGSINSGQLGGDILVKNVEQLHGLRISGAGSMTAQTVSLASKGDITVSQRAIQGRISAISSSALTSNNKVQIEVSEGFLSVDQVGTESGSVSLKARDGITVFNSVIANEGNISLLATNGQGVIDIKPDALIAAVRSKHVQAKVQIQVGEDIPLVGVGTPLPDDTSFQISNVSTSISNVIFKNGAQLNGGILVGVDDNVQPVGLVVDNPTGAETAPIVQSVGGQVILSAGAGAIFLHSNTGILANYQTQQIPIGFLSNINRSTWHREHNENFEYAGFRSPSSSHPFDGEFLIHTYKATEIKLSERVILQIGAGSVVLVNNTPMNREISCLVEDGKSVSVVVDEAKLFDLSSGQRLSIGSGDDNIARRRAQSVRIRGLRCVHSEFSFPALFAESLVLSKYWKESGSSKLSKRVEKTQAALFTITNNHGAYERN